MHKKTAPSFVHYGEPEKIEKSFAFNVDIFILFYMIKKKLYRGKKAYTINITRLCLEEMIMLEKLVIVPKKQRVDIRQE